MNAFTPKTYQQQVLDSVEAYFKACYELPSPSVAFAASTDSPLLDARATHQGIIFKQTPYALKI
jgi:hypothetical protein